MFTSVSNTYCRHTWKMSEIGFISQHLDYFSDLQLANRFGVSENALVKARIYYNIRREPLGKSFALSKIPRWKYVTDPGQLVLSFKPTAHTVLQKAIRLLKSNCFDCARILVNEETTLEVFNQIVHIAESKHRDCWHAMANYVLRAIEVEKNKTYEPDLRKRLKTMRQKCNLC